RYEKHLRGQYPLLEWVPMLFVSAVTGQRVRQVLTAAAYVYDQAGARVPTAVLNETLRAAIATRQPPARKGRRLQIFHGTQARAPVPAPVRQHRRRAAPAARQAPARNRRRLKIFYGTQVGTRPPQIVLFVNDPALLHVSYQRFLENQIRVRFGFAGTPLRLIL